MAREYLRGKGEMGMAKVVRGNSAWCASELVCMVVGQDLEREENACKSLCPSSGKM